MGEERKDASNPTWRLSSLWNRTSVQEGDGTSPVDPEQTWTRPTLASQSMHSFSTFHSAAGLSASTLAFPDAIHKKYDDDWSSHHGSLFDKCDEDASEYFDDTDEPPVPKVPDLKWAKSVKLDRVRPQVNFKDPIKSDGANRVSLLKPADRGSWLARFSTEGFNRPLSEAFFREQLRCVSESISNLPGLADVRKSGDAQSIISTAGPGPEPPQRPRSIKFANSHDDTSEQDNNVVGWEGPHDAENPMNWPRKKKWWITIMLGLVTFTVTFASSVLSPGTESASLEFGVSPQIFVLSTSLFVLGFAFGPICWGPLSEIYGRRRPMFLGLAGFAICQIPVGAAPNLVTVLVCRFLQGLFGCAPLAIIGGSLADIWAPMDRGVAVSLFSAATFMGPTMGPIFGGYLTEAAGWRYTAWLNLTLTMVIGTFGYFVCPETYGPVLLQRRARRLRYSSKNWAIHAPADEQDIDMHAIFSKYFTRPFAMLWYEPILLLMTIYTAFIYGILYGFFETYPLSFNVQRGWGLGDSGLPFIAVMAGVLLAGLVNLVFTKTRYARIQRLKGRVPPEERLLPMIIGAILLPIGLLWFAWTSSPDIDPTMQIVAGVPAGMGIVLIFLQGINYIVDTYTMLSASALAGNIFIRSLVGFAFPLFATPMFRALGLTWANTVLGFIAIALIPVPIVFYLYGARIRKTSRFAPKFPGVGRPGPPMNFRRQSVGVGPPRTAPQPPVAPRTSTPETPMTEKVLEVDESTIGMAITTPGEEAPNGPLPPIPIVSSPIKC